ncbi:hypothetical protein EV702DRAFT_1203770 [Suillus placidus]|uniref:Uncharacterized protein n=1 Tax=Suillus placidus TaxID=48579 RepID=A0A9P7CX32_9AGAM|nr:hypothetical protein EV702DRAFT_1203770 [Suillus placidus]
MPAEQMVNAASHGVICASASNSVFQDKDVLDIAVDDIAEQDNDIPDPLGQHPSGSRHTVGLVLRDFTDLLPADEDINPSDTDPSSVNRSPDPPLRRIQRVILMLHRSLQTVFNVFGLCRQYPRQPSFGPDRLISSSLLSNSCPMTADAHDVQTQTLGLSLKPPYPFPNMTTYRLMAWMNSGSH